MKRNRKSDDNEFTSPDVKRHCDNDNSVTAAASPHSPKPSYVEVGTFVVGERSFPKRRRVPAGMRTNVPVWAFRVRSQKARSALTKYIVFTPTDVEVLHACVVGLSQRVHACVLGLSRRVHGCVLGMSRRVHDCVLGMSTCLFVLSACLACLASP